MRARKLRGGEWYHRWYHYSPERLYAGWTPAELVEETGTSWRVLRRRLMKLAAALDGT